MHEEQRRLIVEGRSLGHGDEEPHGEQRLARGGDAEDLLLSPSEPVCKHCNGWWNCYY